MYSANDWRCYALLHADKVGKWEWPGGNNSKAYNDWYYSHHKDKWRQYYLNKKKSGNSKALSGVRDYLAINKINGDYESNNVARKTGGAVKGINLAARMLSNPERIEDARKVDDAVWDQRMKGYRVHDRFHRLIGPRTHTYQDAAEYPEQQTPSRGASRRRQTR